jgi:elongator complex protein 3
MDFYTEILDRILSSKIQNKTELHRAKIELCKKYKLKELPSDPDILLTAPDDIYELVEPLLRIKPMRTISGVAPVAVMTSPDACPHGKCMYCPGGVEAGTPQSYTGHEPAALRASSHEFDPYQQTKSRLEQLKVIGHQTDKIDLIVMGGTFTARDPEYQTWFIRRCFDAMNEQESRSLPQAQEMNETGPHRCIGLTIETRPDWCKESHVDRILEQGGTRVELGVQTVFNDILGKIERGHTVEDSVEATQILKDSGLKVCYHMMPGLPGSDRDRDIESFKTIFTNPDFMPDMLKIYPTLVVQGTKLYEDMLNNVYKPLTTQEAVVLIAEVKKLVPKWVRIQRIQRDIPSTLIEGDGILKSNLRQLVLEHLKKTGISCNCIRCREVGHKTLKNIQPDNDSIVLTIERYKASGGEELFLAYEDTCQDILIGFTRLRLVSSSAHRAEFNNGTTTIIRELKIFGPMVELGEGPKTEPLEEWQHRGYGKILMNEAEKIAVEDWDTKRMLVNSGVGVRNYYRKLGYERDGVYMGKTL